MTVTACRASSPRNSPGDRDTAYGTTTTRPPCSSAPNSSHTEKSNADEWNQLHTSPAPNPNHPRVAANKPVTLA